jgi:hypothetical protein
MVKLIKSELSKNGFKFNSTTMSGKNKEYGETISFIFNSKGEIKSVKYDNGWIENNISGNIKNSDIKNILTHIFECSNEHRNLSK